jgi:hypothetical protein
MRYTMSNNSEVHLSVKNCVHQKSIDLLMNITRTFSRTVNASFTMAEISISLRLLSFSRDHSQLPARLGFRRVNDNVGNEL